MMSKPFVNNSDVERQPMAEPTKYILRCCELRKRREVRSAPAAARQRVRVNVER